MTHARIEPGGIPKRKGTRDVKNLSFRFIFAYKCTRCSIFSFRIFTRFARPLRAVFMRFEWNEEWKSGREGKNL